MKQLDSATELVQFAYPDNDQEDTEYVVSMVNRVINDFQPVGLMVHECQLLDSSRAGERTILPYGGGATIQEIPDGPFSPRGLASDTGSIVAFCIL